MWLYIALLGTSFFIPLLLSFDKKIQFYKQWKFLFPTIFIVAAFYIIFDIYFTRYGVWGFNAAYHFNFKIFGLPIEEWLFFIIIPYSCIFLHDTITTYFPNLRLTIKQEKGVTISLLIWSVFIIIRFNDKIYTVFIYGLLLFSLIISLFDKKRILQTYYYTFLILLVPFIFINGILTGSFIDGAVVWYNETQNMGLRVFTIPFEDFTYAFTLIYFNLYVRNLLKTFF